jgi:hypothetical protein
MMKVILNDEHLGGVLKEAFETCRHRLFIATADVKELHIPTGAKTSRGRRGKAESILDVLDRLAKGNIEIRLLHSGIPSGPFLERLKEGVPRTLTMRRCPRVHAKAVIVDGRAMYLGSANLTGAGLGAKSALRRNFEAGLWTDDPSLIDAVLDMLETVWSGGHCEKCGRKEHCPEPLEEPAV